MHVELLFWDGCPSHPQALADLRTALADVQPAGDEPVGLTCRIYRRRDGRLSPLPDPDDLRAALRAALPEPAG